MKKRLFQDIGDAFYYVEGETYPVEEAKFVLYHVDKSKKVLSLEMAGIPASMRVEGTDVVLLLQEFSKVHDHRCDRKLKLVKMNSDLQELENKTLLLQKNTYTYGHWVVSMDERYVYSVDHGTTYNFFQSGGSYNTASDITVHRIALSSGEEEEWFEESLPYEVLNGELIYLYDMYLAEDKVVLAGYYLTEEDVFEAQDNEDFEEDAHMLYCYLRLDFEQREVTEYPVQFCGSIPPWVFKYGDQSVVHALTIENVLYYTTRDYLYSLRQTPLLEMRNEIYIGKEISKEFYSWGNRLVFLRYGEEDNLKGWRVMPLGEDGVKKGSFIPIDQ